MDLTRREGKQKRTIDSTGAWSELCKLPRRCAGRRHAPPYPLLWRTLAAKASLHPFTIADDSAAPRWHPVTAVKRSLGLPPSAAGGLAAAAQQGQDIVRDHLARGRGLRRTRRGPRRPGSATAVRAGRSVRPHAVALSRRVRPRAGSEAGGLLDAGAGRGDRP